MNKVTGAILFALVCTALAVDEPSPPNKSESHSVTVGSSMTVSSADSSSKAQPVPFTPLISVPVDKPEQRRYPGPVIQYNPPPAGPTAGVAQLTVVAQSAPGELPAGVQASPSYLYGSQPGRVVGPTPNSYFTLGIPQQVVAPAVAPAQQVVSQPAVPAGHQVVVGSPFNGPQVYNVPSAPSSPVRGAGVNPSGSFLVGNQARGPGTAVAAAAAVAPPAASTLALRSPQVVYGRPVAGVQVAPPAAPVAAQPVQTVQYVQPAAAPVYQQFPAYQPAPVSYYGQPVALSAPVQVGGYAAHPYAGHAVHGQVQAVPYAGPLVHGQVQQFAVPYAG